MGTNMDALEKMIEARQREANARFERENYDDYRRGIQEAIDLSRQEGMTSGGMLDGLRDYEQAMSRRGFNPSAEEPKPKIIPSLLDKLNKIK